MFKNNKKERCFKPGTKILSATMLPKGKAQFMEPDGTVYVTSPIVHCITGSSGVYLETANSIYRGSSVELVNRF